MLLESTSMLVGRIVMRVMRLSPAKSSVPAPLKVKGQTVHLLSLKRVAKAKLRKGAMPEFRIL